MVGIGDDKWFVTTWGTITALGGGAWQLWQIRRDGKVVGHVSTPGRDTDAALLLAMRAFDEDAVRDGGQADV